MSFGRVCAGSMTLVFWLSKETIVGCRSPRQVKIVSRYPS
ncbi:MAG: hypothetical protein QOH41_585 [Blastocatellia bacterium]|nr:hypothetical protein [Blastocatellia bacterium]